MRESRTAGEKHTLLFYRVRLQFPEPTQQLTTTYNSSSGDLPTSVFHGDQAYTFTYIHVSKIFIHINKNKNKIF